MMPTSKGKILFFTGKENCLKEYFPLMEELAKKNFTPITVIDWDCTSAWLRKLDQRGISYVGLKHQDFKELSDHKKSASAGKYSGEKAYSSGPFVKKTRKSSFLTAYISFFRKTPFWQEFQQIKIFWQTLKKYYQLKKMIMPLFSKVKPDLIVLPGGANIRRMVPLKLSQNRKIPSLLLPLFYIKIAPTAKHYMNSKGLDSLHSTNSLINKIVAKLIPSLVYKENNVSILRDPGGEALVTWFFGLLPENPWVVGSALATRVAVQNNYEYRKMLAGGLTGRSPPP